MFSLPSRPEKREQKCRIMIDEVHFLEGPPKQIEIRDVENLGNVECMMKGIVSIRFSTSSSWVEVPVVWNPASLPPGDITNITFHYEWISGETYFIKVITERGLETVESGKAP